MLSIKTNSSAMVALQNLSATQREMDKTQSRISTGLRVASASDNAAYWSIATTMQSDNSALATVKDALNLGSATIDTANAGLTASKDLVNQIKTKLVAATQPGVDRAKVQDEIGQLQKQLKSVADSATFSGQNWLSVDSAATGYNATRSIVASFTRDNTNAVTIQTIDVNVGSKTLFDATQVAMVTDGSGAITTAAQGGIIDKDRMAYVNDKTSNTGGKIEIKAKLSTLDISALTDSAADLTKLDGYVKIADAALTDIVSASSSLGASKARVATQQTFVSSLSDSITKGVGALTDADMTEESTRLQALQTQQQLGVQSLSIANQQTQSVLSLFR